MIDKQRVLLKDQLFNRGKVAQIAAELSRSERTFAAAAFEAEVMSRLPELELKQRIAWIADCLEASLPGDYRRAVNVLLRSLPAPCDPALSDHGFQSQDLVQDRLPSSVASAPARAALRSVSSASLGRAIIGW